MCAKFKALPPFGAGPTPFYTKNLKPSFLSMETYNGWRNYETWNVALWLHSDESLYNLVKKCKNYKEAVLKLNYFGYTRTDDGVSFRSTKLDRTELNKFIKELS